MTLRFKKVNLDDQIRQAVAQAQASADASEGGVFSATIGMHIRAMSEPVNGQMKVRVLVVPEQTGPSEIDVNTGQSVYGDTIWGPCPADLRATGYHDPHPPGATLTGDGGMDDLYVWVENEGYVPAASPQAGGLQFSRLVQKVYDDLATLVNAFHAAP